MSLKFNFTRLQRYEEEIKFDKQGGTALMRPWVRLFYYDKEK